MSSPNRQMWRFALLTALLTVVVASSCSDAKTHDDCKHGNCLWCGYSHVCVPVCDPAKSDCNGDSYGRHQCRRHKAIKITLLATLIPLGLACCASCVYCMWRTECCGYNRQREMPIYYPPPVYVPPPEPKEMSSSEKQEDHHKKARWAYEGIR